MTRWKAAAIHLAISAVVIGVVATGLISMWYGWELFHLMGGAKLLLLLAVCDIVIGPLLTLIVYKAGKKSLAFDLAVIVLLQLGFLAYGMYIMAASRPVFLVGVLDRFELVFANEIAADDLAKGQTPESRTLSWTGPRLVGGKMGQTSQERLDLSMSGLAGRDIQHIPERFVPYDEIKADVLANAKPVEGLIEELDAGEAGKLRAAVESTGLAPEQVRFVPITSRRARATMLIDAESGTVLRSVAVDPWPDLSD